MTSGASAVAGGEGAVPAVSVLIPARDEESRIGTALTSVREQGIEGVEVVVVDDGSTDATAAVAAAFDEVRVIPCRGRGIVDALNTGIDACRAPLIARLDADDHYLPGGLRRLLSAAGEHPETALVVGTSMQVDPDGRVLGGMTPPLDERHLAFANAGGNDIEHSAVLMRAAAVRSLGGYRRGEVSDEAQDADLWERFVEAGLQVVGLTDAVVVRVVRPSSLSARRFDDQAAYAETVGRRAFVRWVADGRVRSRIVALGRDAHRRGGRDQRGLVQVRAVRVARRSVRLRAWPTAVAASVAAAQLGLVNLAVSMRGWLRWRRRVRSVWGR
jgi:glycosyltransferase involved in cell wall biosynthesis